MIARGGKRHAFSAVIAAATLSACVSSADPQAQVQNRAWARIARNADAVPLGDGRLRIDASTAFAQDLAVLEYTALARAAGEVSASGADRFAVVYVDYGTSGLSGLISPTVTLPGDGWIGTYEDLMAARDWSTIGGGIGDRYGFRTLTMVVRILEEDEAVGRPAFGADAVYRAMLAERIAREDIAPRRRLAWPF